MPGKEPNEETANVLLEASDKPPSATEKCTTVTTLFLFIYGLHMIFHHRVDLHARGVMAHSPVIRFASYEKRTNRDHGNVINACFHFVPGVYGVAI